MNNSLFVNECEANIQTESVGQGRFASRLYFHLPKEDEGGNDNLDGCIESDDSNWSYASTDGSDDDHDVRRKSRFPAFDPKAKKFVFCLGMSFFKGQPSSKKL